MCNHSKINISHNGQQFQIDAGLEEIYQLLSKQGFEINHESCEDTNGWIHLCFPRYDDLDNIRQASLLGVMKDSRHTLQDFLNRDCYFDVKGYNNAFIDQKSGKYIDDEKYDFKIYAYFKKKYKKRFIKRWNKLVQVMTNYSWKSDKIDNVSKSDESDDESDTKPKKYIERSINYNQSKN